MTLLFDIGFLTIRIWDVLDVLVFGYLMYRIYRLLRGSIAFNIFVGVIFLFAIWFLVEALKMDLLSILFGQFASVGVLVLIIIFQPEVRRFLLLIGNSTLQQRTNFIARLWNKSFDSSEHKTADIYALKNALLEMAKQKIGALIVLSNELELEDIRSSGTTVEAEVSKMLLVSIFSKESPLHDGAVIIGNGKIRAAGCILPVSDSTALPPTAGLRHRAAVGITERANVVSLVVSEETGIISFSKEGGLKRHLGEEKLQEILEGSYR